MKKIISTPRAPRAIGPYAQANAVDDFVFTAGQIALVPETGLMVEGGVAQQTKQVLENIKAVVEASGMTMESIVKTTVYLTNPEDFPKMNQVYAQYFAHEPPARTTIFVNSLPKDGLVEIDAIAKK